MVSGVTRTRPWTSTRHYRQKNSWQGLPLRAFGDARRFYRTLCIFAFSEVPQPAEPAQSDAFSYGVRNNWVFDQGPPPDEQRRDARWYPLVVCLVGIVVFLALAWLFGMRGVRG